MSRAQPLRPQRLRPLLITHRWSSRCQPGPLDSEPQGWAWTPLCNRRDRVLGPEGSSSLCRAPPWQLLTSGLLLKGR